MNRILSRSIFFITVTIIAACAKINTPTGGLKDRTPPKVVESSPANGSKNFHGKRIEIEFDENVSLENVTEKLMVSPPMKKQPRVVVRGKEIRIDFEEKLRDSTTYALNFFDAIKDLNEGNILENYKFVFSTGQVIDSLSVTGNVYNAVDLEVPEKTSVFLYSDITDSAVVKKIPDYVSGVDATGYFRIDNVRPGTYRLYALKDEDNSKNYNRLEEAFAFLDSVINVSPEKNYILLVKDTIRTIKVQQKKQATTNTTQKNQNSKKTATAIAEPEIPIIKGDYRMTLFTALKRARYLSNSSRNEKYRLLFVLSVPPDTMKFNLRIREAGENSFFTEQNVNRDSITVWLTDSMLYSQPVLNSIITYPYTDSTGFDTYKTDTIPMRFFIQAPPKSKKSVRQKLSVRNNASQGTLKPGQKILFTSETPLKEPDTSRVKLYEVVEKANKLIPYQIIKDSLNRERYTLDADLGEGKQYLLITDSASFVNIYNEASDSTGIRFKVREAESFSKLIINLTNVKVPSIIQLLDKSEKILAHEEINSDGKVVFSLLEKGVYRLRVIYDLNGDGKWTTGNYFKHQQPEPSSYYPDELDIPEGWQAEQRWDVSNMNFKPQKLRQKPKK
ncbi:MAG TPA: Ig-like domain-containing domain [Bacteroidales bacterium]|nr:Ig-like domain-containing domain [Bacteroidales bacterium]